MRAREFDKKFDEGKDISRYLDVSKARRPEQEQKRVNVDFPYYVYVYIDPRNFEEFYYGKGRGSRKDAHLFDQSDTEKTKRIAAIQAEGLTPIIRVISRDLSEHDAFLIEKTLLWKLGKWTTNISSGHFAENFRPHNTMHRELPGFDFQSGVYYYNVGEGEHRSWDDYIKYNFISAGQGKRWRDGILGFNPGDVFFAYIKRHGFVGIGRIKTAARKICEVTINNKPLLTLPLKCKNMGANLDNDEKSEYVALVEWEKKVLRGEAQWTSKPKLYTTTHIRASLDGQPATIDFLEKEFKVDIKKLLI